MTHPGLSQAWLKLLHMFEKNNGGWHSDVTAPGFFLSPEGRHNPIAEWDATVSSFTRPYDGDPNEHPQCLFPARVALINKLTGSRFLVDRCPMFQAWAGGIAAKSATIVHAAQYVQNPASMFGHLFLRFDVAEPGDQSLRLDTLAHSVGFFAQMPEGVSAYDYAVKGLGGGFKGRFMFSTYAQSLVDYSQLEDRDLWEYQLDLSTDDLAQLVNHVWEMRRFGEFDYYFLYQNCAYQVLALVEAAIPRWDLIEAFHAYLIPSDGVRVLRQQKAIRQVRYRPSLGTKLRRSVKYFSPTQRVAMQDLLSEDRRSASVEDPAVLEAVSELVDYRTHQTKGHVPAYYEAVKHEALAQRSTMAPSVASPSDPVNIAPHAGHGPAKASVGYLWDEGAKGMTLGVRPAMHRVTDGPGYPSGLSLELLDLRLLLDAPSARVFVDRLTIFRVENLREYESIDQGLAWRLLIGWERSIFDEGVERRARFTIAPAIGLASYQGSSGGVFAMVSVPVYGPFGVDNDLVFALAGVGGVTVLASDQFSSRVEFAIERVMHPGVFVRTKASADLRFHLNPSLSIEGSLEATKDRHRVGAGLGYFF